MAAELDGGETVLTGPLADQSAMFGVLGQIEALGLELLELRRTDADLQRTTRPRQPPGGKSPASGDDASPG